MFRRKPPYGSSYMPKRQFRFQYTLRSFLLLFVVVALVLGLITDKYRRILAAARPLQPFKMRGWAAWDYECDASGAFIETPITLAPRTTVSRPGWYDEWLHRIVYVNCGPASSHQTIQYLQDLPSVRCLIVGGKNFDDKDISVVGGLTQLESLYLDRIRNITDDGLKNLKNLPGLRTELLQTRPSVAWRAHSYGLFRVPGLVERPR